MALWDPLGPRLPRRRRVARATASVVVIACAIAAFAAAPSAIEPPRAHGSKAEAAGSAEGHGVPVRSLPVRPGLRVERNLHYGAPGSPALDVYHRPGAQRLLPAVIVVHGGAWSFGTRRRMAHVARAAAGHGFVAFNVGYTLSRPGRPGFRTQQRELRTAVRWARRHALHFGADPRRIGALGSSAGGNLAALLATKGHGRLDAGARVGAAVAWSAPFDLGGLQRGWPARAVDGFVGCPRAQCAGRLAAASPIRHVTPDDPPLLIVNSKDEIVPVRQAYEMAAQLAAVGVPHRVELLEGPRHGIEYAAGVLGPSLDYLRRRLAELR